jgi:tetratricopeptide (TPR) repeat protein
VISVLKKKWPLIAGLVVTALALVLALPCAISAYHLQAGGQALERALGRHDALEWWYVGPREARDPQALQAAIAHLEKANRAPYAQRLLAQAYVAQGDTLSGVHALEQFVERRPKHYLAQLELAAAYVYADARLPELQYLDLLSHLEGAHISAPDLGASMHYSAEGWQSEYVYPTVYSLPPEYGDRPALFVHAGSQVTWTVTLTQPSVLRFGMGQEPRSLGWGGDGATFEVFANGERIFMEHLPPEQALEGWHERHIDLASYAGRTIYLSLATTPGPVGDVTGDWAGWGEPRLEDVQAFAYRRTVKSQPWRAKWSEMGVTAVDWIEAGEVARKAEQYETALTWYTWAERLSPERGDAWYYRGMVYQDQQRWSEALVAFERAIEVGHLKQVPQSSPHYRAGVIYQQRLVPPQLEAAAAAFEKAAAADDFNAAGEAADCHYKLGNTLRELGAPAESVLAAFERAVALDASHVWAHIQLGVSLYATAGDVHRAEDLFRTALELAPRNKWIYYYWGEMYRQEGRQEAIQMYRQALEIDPEFERARQRLQALSLGERNP